MKKMLELRRLNFEDNETKTILSHAENQEEVLVLTDTMKENIDVFQCLLDGGKTIIKVQLYERVVETKKCSNFRFFKVREVQSMPSKIHCSDYIEYIQFVNKHIGTIACLPPKGVDFEPIYFHYTNTERNKEEKIDITKTILYAIDIPLKSLSTDSYHSFMENFKAKRLFSTSGKYCYLQFVDRLNDGLFGPYLSLCPSLEVYASLYQDGGTGDVDSVHFNLSGCDEFVLFPPTLTIEEKQTVYNLLNTFSKKGKTFKDLSEIEKECNFRQFEDSHNKTAFYLKRFPKKRELDILEERHHIPNLKIMLKPGELVFIKAGQLFACRKKGKFPLRKERDDSLPLRSIQQDDCVNSFCWNVKLYWHLLFIGYNKKTILSLAETKWRNNYSANKLGFGTGLGSIETPLFSMIHRYGSMGHENLMKKGLSHISLLFSGLLPLICKIITIQSHYIPYMGFGEIIYKSESTKYSALKRLLELDLMNAKCESCGYNLSNSFMTCTTCLTITNNTINICLQCYNNKRTDELKSSITSNLHSDNKIICCRRTFEEERIESKILQECQCKETSLLPIHRDMYFIKLLDLPKLETNKQKTKSCKECECECTKCFPMNCNCHNSFELIHWWRNEKEIRQILRSFQKNFDDSGDSYVDQYYDPFHDTNRSEITDLDNLSPQLDSSPLNPKDLISCVNLFLPDDSRNSYADQYYESYRCDTYYNREIKESIKNTPVPNISPIQSKDFLSSVEPELDGRFMESFEIDETIFDDFSTMIDGHCNGRVNTDDKNRMDVTKTNARYKTSMLHKVHREKRTHEESLDLVTRSTDNEMQRKKRPQKQQQLLHRTSNITTVPREKRTHEESLDLDTRSTDNEMQREKRPQKQQQLLHQNSNITTDATGETSVTFNIMSKLSEPRCHKQTSTQVNGVQFNLKGTTKDIAENKAHRDTYMTEDINTLNSSTTRRSSPLEDSTKNIEKPLLTCPNATALKDGTKNIQKSIFSSPEATALIVLSNFDAYSKKRDVGHVYQDDHKPSHEERNTAIAPTKSSTFSNEKNRKLLQKFDTILEPTRRNTRSVEYNPSEESWLVSFEHAKQVLQSKQNGDYSIEEEKKVKNWLQNQNKTKKRRPEYMNEKLFSIGEIAYSNSIMLEKWKQNRNHPACIRWRKTLYRFREKLDDDIKDLLIDNKVFILQDFIKKKNSKKEQKKTKE